MTERKRCGCRAKAGDAAKESIATTKVEQEKALKDIPGAAIDAADREKVSESLLEERTDTLGFNPHTIGE